MEFHQT